MLSRQTVFAGAGQVGQASAANPHELLCVLPALFIRASTFSIIGPNVKRSFMSNRDVVSVLF